VVEVEDVGVEAEGLQECGVHEPILPSRGAAAGCPLPWYQVQRNAAAVSCVRSEKPRPSSRTYVRFP
jgi:hypothetical protein